MGFGKCEHCGAIEKLEVYITLTDDKIRICFKCFKLFSKRVGVEVKGEGYGKKQKK
jgi:predicted nucleic acid-binding Zn ribbon protein